MKSGKGFRIVYKSLYIVSALLALTFVVFSVIMTYRYYTRFTGSFPLYAYFLMYGIFYLLPGMITLTAAFIVHRIYRKKRLAATDIK